MPNVILIAFLNNVSTLCMDEPPHVSHPYNRAAFKHDVSIFLLTVMGVCGLLRIKLASLIYTDLDFASAYMFMSLYIVPLSEKMVPR